MSAFFSLPHIEDCHKRIRAYAHGVCLIDTKKAKLVWLHEKYPTYFVCKDDLPLSWYLVKSGETETEITFNITVGPTGSEARYANAVVLYLAGPLKDLAHIKFDKMDAWFEEDEEIFVHVKDPYKRIDVLQSSRHVRIEINGLEIANTRAPRLLFETGLPVRTYIPKTDCRMDFWETSKTVTACPYKGTAHYYNLVFASGDTCTDIAWWYPNTTVEASGIRGFVAFFDEKVDVFVDGEKQVPPRTYWS